MNVIPCEFRSAPNGLDAYYVTLFCIFDGERVFHFLHESEMLDNLVLAHEVGFSTSVFTTRIFVSKSQHVELYNMITDYVSSSDSD